MVVGSPTVLNLIPGGVMPVIMINETDKGYQKEFLIYNGNAPYNVPANVSATIRGTKRDGLGVAEAATVTAGSNVVRITVTEQMTAVPGKNIFELVFVNTNGLRVATINFIMLVERSALNANTVISDSDIAYSEQVLNQLQGVAAYAEALDNKPYKFDTVAQMQADTALKAGMYAQTGGYYAVNDGGAALYRIYNTVPSTYYESLANGLYAELVTENTVHPEQFGAYGDGVHDDSTAFERCNGCGIILRQNATYLINASAASLFNKSTIIYGNNATIHIVFSGQNYPNVFYGNNSAVEYEVNNCTFLIDVTAGTSRSRVFNLESGTLVLKHVNAVINKVPSSEKVSFAESNRLFVYNCHITNNSQCVSDGGTLWAKGTNSELTIRDSYILGNHHDEVVANYGNGYLQTEIANSTIVTSSKITLRSLADNTAISKARISKCDITYTQTVMALDIGGRSSNDIYLSDCTFHGNVSYILESSTFTDNPIVCYVENCNFSDVSYSRFVDASLAISLFIYNSDINYLMANPSSFRLKKISLTNCHINEMFLIDVYSDTTPETVSVDIWIDHCVIDTVYRDTKTRTADNPHIMINAFVAGSYMNRYV